MARSDERVAVTSFHLPTSCLRIRTAIYGEVVARYPEAIRHRPDRAPAAVPSDTAETAPIDARPSPAAHRRAWHASAWQKAAGYSIGGAPR